MSIKKYADSTGLTEFWSKVKGRSIELTQSQYNALTQEEKENGTIYFITDGISDYMIVNDSVPVGAIQSYGGLTAPNGWLICDGSAVSRTTYAELFEAIGTTYGSGDGSTTFNIPDLKGRVLVGVGNSGATGSTNHTLGQKDGEEKHLLTTNEMPSHSHEVSWQGGYAVSLNQSGSAGSYQLQWNHGAGEGRLYGNSVGGGQVHNIMQPYTVANYIIKAKSYSQGSSIQGLNASNVGAEDEDGNPSDVQTELDALNDVTYRNITLTDTTKYKVVEGTNLVLAKCGHLAMLTGTIFCITPYSTWPGLTVASGLPKPVGTTPTVNAPSGSPTQIMRVRISLNGELICRYGVANTDYTFCLTYICE